MALQPVARGHVMDYDACLAEDAPPCPRADVCETLPLWAEYDKLVHDFFYSKKLSDLIRQENTSQQTANA